MQVLMSQDCDQARQSEAVVLHITDPPAGNDKHRISILTTYPRPTLRLVCVAGDVDAATAPALREACTGGPRDQPPLHDLVVDLTRVAFLASAGLHVLLECHAQFATFGLVAPHPSVAVPLRITGLDGVLSVHACLADALCVLDG